MVLGARGLRDNLELPLLMTLIAMPMTLLAWRLLEQPHSRWHTIAITVLLVAAVGALNLLRDSWGETLLGVALFHYHTLKVALAGLAAITIYKLLFTGFAHGTGIAGLGVHVAHEWVILANLLGLLLGFALLSKHFEESNIPAELPKFLPDDWKGGFWLLVIVFVLFGMLIVFSQSSAVAPFIYTLF